MSKVSRIGCFMMCCMAVSTIARAERLYCGVGVFRAEVDGIAETAATRSARGTLPAHVTLDGLPFDASDESWQASCGWRFSPHWSLEAAYRDLGDFESVPIGFGNPGATLTAREWSLSGKLSFPLGARLALIAHGGVGRASFSVRGMAPVLVLLRPLPFDPGPGSEFIPGGILPLPPSGRVGAGLIELPFAAPDDETSFAWGVGIRWQVSRRIALELTRSRREVKVLQVDTSGLAVTLSL